MVVEMVDLIREAENGSSTDKKPPNPLGGAYRRCFSAATRAAVPCSESIVRSTSFLSTKILGTALLDVSGESNGGADSCDKKFLPVLRSGAWGDIGFRQQMEDVHVCFDDFVGSCDCENKSEEPYAFYGVFDGHGGKQAADFVSNNLPKFILENEDFPLNIEEAVSSAFLQTDTAFAEACSLDSALDSGTTALAALVIGRYLVVANAGDCRAVLCRRGKAIEMSRDHKPACLKERKRIEACGGFVDDGYLNGQLNVARALGDWHIEGMKEMNGMGPLSAEPEFTKMMLTEEDEFLIIGCDGIWEVFRSQNAVDFARRKLQENNDPLTCCKELVGEALKRKSSDNLSVVVVCFNSGPPPSFSVPRGRVQRSISAEGLKELQGLLNSLGN